MEQMEMDLVHDRATDIPEEEEEDRISNLPDEIIHRILSFIDMKYAIQTCSLSKKWKYMWTSMPYLKLDTHMFRTMPQFIKFMKHALSHRNQRTEVSAVELKFRGGFNQLVAKSILKYAYFHNLKQLTIIWSTLSMKIFELPQNLFSSHTLKHLNLTVTSGFRMHAPKSAWDFSALETLNLTRMRFGDYGVKSLDLFSKCVNLKDLTLHNCVIRVDVFNVCAPQLSNLTVTDSFEYPKVFNMVAPQLESLTALVCNCSPEFLQLSTEDLNSLEKVNLSMRPSVDEKERYAPGLQDLFQKLCGAKFLILDEDIIAVLSECLDQPCPFNNLKYLKIDKQKNPTATLPAEVRNYFLESSPNVTFIMDLSQVPRKRSRQEADKDTMTKKVAKLEEEKQAMAEEKRTLEAKIAMQDGVIAEQKSTLEAMKLMSRMINCKMAELQVQVAGGDPGYDLVCLIKSIMELTPESFRLAMEAQISCLYGEMKSLFFTQIDASQWAKIEMELGITERTRSNNIVHSRSDVPAAALPLAPSLADVATSSDRE